MSEFLQTRLISSISKFFAQNHFQTVYILIHISSSIYFANKNSHFPLITIETLNYFKKNNASQYTPLSN